MVSNGLVFRLRRARFFGTHAPRDRENQPEMPERKHAGGALAVLARPLSLASYPVATGRPLPGHQRPRARVRVMQEVNAGGRKPINQNSAGDPSIVQPAAAAPPRRPEPVEQHRAGRNHISQPQFRRARFFGTHAPRDQENQPEMPERKHAGAPDAVLARPLSLASYPVATGRPLPGHQRPRARVRVMQEVNAGGRKSINQNSAGDPSIVQPAAAAPPRRPEPVEQHRAGRNHISQPQFRRARFFGTHAPRDQENQPEMPERKHAGAPDAVLARPLSLASYPVATGRPLPGHQRPRARVRVMQEVNAGGRKSINQNSAGDPSIVQPAAAAPPRRPEPVEQHRAGRNHIHNHNFAAPDSSAPTRQGIKRTSRKCRRESTPEPPMLFWRDPSRWRATP